MVGSPDVALFSQFMRELEAMIVCMCRFVSQEVYCTYHSMLYHVCMFTPVLLPV